MFLLCVDAHKSVLSEDFPSKCPSDEAVSSEGGISVEADARSRVPLALTFSFLGVNMLLITVPALWNRVAHAFTCRYS